MENDRKLVIAVLERGFVYVGEPFYPDDGLVLRNAFCIRRWGTSRGLGELALTGPTKNTVLDPAGTVRAPISAVIHTIDCELSAWKR